MASLDFDALYTLAQYRGWELEVIPAYTREEPPTYVLTKINGPYACAFQALGPVLKFLTNEDSK